MRTKTTILAVLMTIGLGTPVLAQALFDVGSTPVTTVASTGQTETTGTILFSMTPDSLPSVKGTISINYGCPITIPAESIRVNLVLSGVLVPGLVKIVSLDNQAGILVLDIPAGLTFANIIVSDVRLALAGNFGVSNVTATVSSTGNTIVAGETWVVVISSISAPLRTPTSTIAAIDSSTGNIVGQSSISASEVFLNVFVPSAMIRIRLSSNPPPGVTISFPGTVTISGATWTIADSSGNLLGTPLAITNGSTSLDVYYKLSVSGPSMDITLDTLTVPLTVSVSPSAALPLPQTSITCTASMAPIGPALGTGGKVLSGPIPRYAEQEVGSATILRILSAINNIAVTLRTDPPAFSLVVDGTSYSAPQTFTWLEGSSHTVSAISPQGATAEARYVFANWNDIGAATRVITTPASATTYTAYFLRQYRLTTSSSPNSAGTVNVVLGSTDGFYYSDSSVQLTASAYPGAVFSGWSGDLTGTGNPQTLIMSAPKHVTANFSAPAPGILTSWYVNPNNGHEYALWGYGNWIDAYNACPPNAHLVTFENASEEDWVWNTFLPFVAPNNNVPPSDRYRFYIGLTNSSSYGASSGNWRWVTGEPVSYTHWGIGEPSDGGEYFAESIRPGNYWNDLGPNTFFYNTQAIFERDSSNSTPEGLPFFEDFDDSQNRRWTFFNRDGRIADGRLWIDGAYKTSSVGRDGWALTQIGNSNWVNYAVDVVYNNQNSSGSPSNVHMATVYVRVAAQLPGARQTTMYRIDVWSLGSPAASGLCSGNWTNGYIELDKYVNGESSFLNYGCASNASVGTNSLRVEVFDNSIDVFSNGQLILHFTDPDPIPYGGIGLGQVWETNGWYDSVVVQPINHSYLPTQERNALIDFYNSTDGANWTNKSGWLGAPGTECSWYGVTCSGDSNSPSVIELNFYRNQLNGNLPSSLGNLTNLQLLSLRSNQLSGAIPSVIGNLLNLKHLSLDSNRLSGGIPSSLSALSNLTVLDLSSNDLTGAIPGSLASLTNMEFLNLAGNRLSGAIPPALGNLINLTFLSLSGNQFALGIPSELGSLTKLQGLYLNNNELTGNIPASFGNLANLEQLNLNINKLNGAIPAQLGRLAKLKFLSVLSNQLSGSIPSELGGLPEIGVLILSLNQLEGNIPASLGNLANLTFLDLSENKLNGAIPIQLKNLANLGLLDIRFNALYSSDQSLVDFLNSHQQPGNWQATQTIAPAGVSAVTQSSSSLLVSWSPIAYTADSGRYEIYISRTSGGPYTLVGSTPDKWTSSVLLTGLSAGTTYYILLRTVTNPHDFNQNSVESDFSQEIDGVTAGSSHSLPLNFTGTAVGSWAYRNLVSGSFGIEYYPTQTSEYQGAAFQGYVTYTNPNSTDGDVVGGFGPVYVGYAYTYHIFTTYVLSSIDQTLHLTLRGDDGHSIFMNDTFIAGGGFGQDLTYDLVLKANIPVKLELADYDSTGPAWGLQLFADSIRHTIENTQGITINANGFAASSITVTTNPAGCNFTVDGNTYTNAQTFTWTVGTSHTIGTTISQGSSGTRVVFGNWSDAGATSHTITTPANATTYTANFTTQYQLTTASSPSSGGTLSITPPSADGFYDSGTPVQLTAADNLGYVFSGWGGNLAGTSNPQSVLMSQPLYVIANFSSGGSPPVTLNSGGAATQKTAGINSTTQAGYVKLAVNSGVTPYGTAVFSFSQNGVVVSEAGVPASPPTRSARIFVDYRKGVNAIPARSDSRKIDVNTGIAILNYSSDTANVTYTLRDRSGNTITVGTGSIEAGHHFACFIDQLKNNGVTGFTLPADFQTMSQFGSLEISSTQPLSILALRGTTNQRNDFLITTTPVADLTQTLGNGSIYFPQFVDGGGYTTSLMLLNTSTVRESGKLEIRDKDGNPLIVNQVGGTRDSSFTYSIEPGGVFRFQTDGFPVDLKAGWVRLIPDAGLPTPVGSGVFGYNPSSILLSESGVPATSATTRACVYVDLSGKHNTGLAIANVSTLGSNITITAYQKDGLTPAGTSKPPFPLAANGYKAGFADDFITGLPAGFTGVLDISSTLPFAALTLRSLDNERGDFLMTTFPVADANQPAPSPIVFPQVADGGGYVTEIILISAGQSASTMITFYDEHGMPIDFGK